jgi:NADH-quinone oxidoreductase subunit F
MPEERVLLKDIEVEGLDNIEVALKHGGYEALRKALKEHAPDELVDIVKKSGLRGRGGAGFPTGMKWAFLPKDVMPRYLVCNADEGEPGTFKDHLLIDKNPHQLIEGIAISSYAIRANLALIYIRGEFAYGASVLERAIAEARGKGFLGQNILGSGYDLEVVVHRGAGAYICGEETALLDSLEGLRGHPRLKPPFPATHGLYSKPTVVNNVETLSCIPHIVMNGADWFAGIGTERSKGTKLFCLSGHVNRPGVYEFPLGTPLREIIYDAAGGIRDGRELRAVIPGGASTPMLTAEHLDTAMDYEAVIEAGSQLGSGAVMVMDDRTCMVSVAARATKFFRHESCGKCAPCREGMDWLYKIYQRMLAGRGKDGDIDLLLDICENIYGKSFCPLGDGGTVPVTSSIKHFRNEYEEHVRTGTCEHPLRISMS